MVQLHSSIHNVSFIVHTRQLSVFIVSVLFQFFVRRFSLYSVNYPRFSMVSCIDLPNTLESGIEVGPTVINLAFFSRPYGLIKDYIKVIQMVIYYIEHVYLRPYVYSFCQIFQALRLFPALRLLRTLEQVCERSNAILKFKLLSIFTARVHQFYASIFVFVNINPFLYTNDQFALVNVYFQFSQQSHTN